MTENEPSLLNRGLVSGLVKGLLIGLAVSAVVMTAWFAIAGVGAVTGTAAIAAGWKAVGAAVFGSAKLGALFAGSLKAPVIAGLVTTGFVASSKMLGEAARVRNEEAATQRHLRQMRESAGREGRAPGLEREVRGPSHGEALESGQTEALEENGKPSVLEATRRRDAMRRAAEERSGGRFA